MSAESTNLHLLEIGRRGRAAAGVIARAGTDAKNAALVAMADAVDRSSAAILDANTADVAAAVKNGLTPAMIDRLRLNAKRLTAISDALRSVAALPDPVGSTVREWTRPNGLNISQVRVPLGVIGIIYESRPNVTCDAGSLCVKSGNAVILRGGSEAIRSNTALAAAMREGLTAAGLPADAVQLVPTTDRADVTAMCGMSGVIDVIIPRGGRGLIETVAREARMPVIKHFDGVCAIYVDADADLAQAEAIAIDAKVRKPGVCNAVETLLVHESVAAPFLASAGRALLAEGVELRCDERSRAIAGPLAAGTSGRVVAATPEDFRTEFLDLKLAVKVVGSAGEAIDHIEANGSHHSDAILTRNETTARNFLAAVDSATVYWNASTRFTDGMEFGFGAEIGISTDKFHARGPMGLEELTSYKYVLIGTGQIRGVR
ncbi:MAG TPA: glutamate-5-semialdehyde dehydrogenase [Opitutaceae bacterium]|nr:glutamate-5-semialdehyde dehydrogenase [Opitutaceae bacterium]